MKQFIMISALAGLSQAAAAHPVETPEEGFVWVDVLAVTPEALKPFDEVKDKAFELELSWVGECTY